MYEKIYWKIHKKEWQWYKDSNLLKATWRKVCLWSGRYPPPNEIKSENPLLELLSIFDCIYGGACSCLKVHMHKILKFIFHIFLAPFNNRQDLGAEFQKFFILNVKFSNIIGFS